MSDWESGMKPRSIPKIRSERWETFIRNPGSREMERPRDKMVVHFVKNSIFINHGCHGLIRCMLTN